MGRKTIEIVLSRKDRAELEAIVADGNTRQKIAKRARIVLLTAEGTGVMAIMRQVEVSKTSVWRWQERFAEAGVVGLLQGTVPGSPARRPLPRRSGSRSSPRRGAQEKPANATHWSVRGPWPRRWAVSPSSVQRIWEGARSQAAPDAPVQALERSQVCRGRCRTSSASTSTRRTRRWCCVSTRNPEIQALDRTQPGLPMKRGRAGTMTHDYKRNGTTTLFAALDAKTGAVIGECLPRHRAKEFIRFLKKIDRIVAKHLDVHAICDNYTTHKTRRCKPGSPSIRASSCTSPRHPPPGSTWSSGCSPKSPANASAAEPSPASTSPTLAIDAWLADRNANPKPFSWTAKAGKIITKHRRAKKALAILSEGCK